MVETIRGISQESDIQSLADAERLLDLGEDYTANDVDEAVQDISLDAHPDQGGTQELFKAVQSAGDVAKGNEGVPPSAAPADQRSVQTKFGPSSTGSSAGSNFSSANVSRGSGSDFSDFGGVSEGASGQDIGPDRNKVKLAILEALGDDFDRETIQEEFGASVSVDKFVNILTDLVISGAISLASIAATVGTNTSFNDKGSDPRFGRGDTRFGSGSSNFSSSGGGSRSGDSNFSKGGSDDSNFG